MTHRAGRFQAAVCAAAIMAAGCGWFDRDEAPGAPSGPATAASLASLEAFDGGVTLERGGQKTAAARGPLFVGDALETGDEASATVRFADGQTVELGPNARFVLAEDSSGVVLQVERGIVLSRVPAGSKAARAERGRVTLSILTPFGVTRIGGGESALKVNVTAEVTTVEVELGEVQLVSRDGETTQAKAGEALEVRAGAVSRVTKANDVLQLETIAVTVHAEGPGSELKKKGEKSWRPIAQGGQPLDDGDAVRVKKGRSSLRLDGNGSSFAVGRGAELTFRKGARGGGGYRAELSLTKGVLALDLARGKKTSVVVDALRLDSDAGGQFELEKTRDGYEVRALAGDATVKQGASPEGREVRAGQRLRYSGAGEPTVEAVTRAELVLPSRPGTKVFHAGLDEVALAWEGGEGDFVVQVATDAAFKNPIREGRVHQAFVNVPAPARGALHWRVFRADGTTPVDKGSATFARETKSKELARLRNEVPDGSEKTTIFFQDKPPAVTFTYRTDANAARYKVAVFRMEDLERPVAESVVAGARAPLEAGVLSEGQYVWSVTPLDGQGQPLRGGRMNQLEMVFDNSVPMLSVTTPLNGQRVRGGTVEAAGVAPVGAKVSINGKPAPLDAKNRFRLAVTPVGRPPMVIFRVMRSNEPDTFTVRVLKRGK